MTEDPNVKAELTRYNYSDLVDLNRDFQFYINHPDKFKKINKEFEEFEGQWLS